MADEMDRLSLLWTAKHSRQSVAIWGRRSREVEDARASAGLTFFERHRAVILCEIM
jgi:hypothetical protein